MRFTVSAGALALAGFAAVSLLATPATAHVIAGDRVFPVTLTFDDPGVGDEATLPQLIWQPDTGQNDYQLQWEFDKTITPTTALIYNQALTCCNNPAARHTPGLRMRWSRANGRR